MSGKCQDIQSKCQFSVEVYIKHFELGGELFLKLQF